MAKLRQTVLANKGYKAFYNFYFTWNRLNSIIGVSLLPVGPTASLLLPNLKHPKKYLSEKKFFYNLKD